MGSGRDKRKKAKGHTPGRGGEKTDRKTEKNEEKSTRRLAKKAAGGEDDIDALLAQFKLQDERISELYVEDDCPPPGARVYSSLVSYKDKDLILYGGEYYDSDKDKTHVYGDVYVYSTDKGTWSHIHTPGGPLPRTSHQAAIHKSSMYVFGGEFTSLNQTKFKHYSDVWRLHLAEWRWEPLPSKGGPSARSGHRMLVYKNYLLLFGGFYDNGKETKYYNDVWSFNVDDLTWQCLGPRPGMPAPAPRGGCQLALHPDQPILYVFGGYSVHYFNVEQDASRRKSRKGRDEGDDGGKGVIHDDVWTLHLKTLTWEKIKKAGMAPSTRSSFAMVVHKRTAVLFGGIFDREGAGEKVYSALFNDTFKFNMDSKRWFPLVLRPPSIAAASAAASAAANNKASVSVNNNRAEESTNALVGMSPDILTVLQRAATRIQAHYRGYRTRKAFETYRLGGPVSELLYSPAAYGIDLSSRDMMRPRARSGAMVTLIKNTMWMFGGMVEISHTDVVLDDVWSLDLHRLDGWSCIKENSAGEEVFRELSVEDWESVESSDEN